MATSRLGASDQESKPTDEETRSEPRKHHRRLVVLILTNNAEMGYANPALKKIQSRLSLAGDRTFVAAVVTAGDAPKRTMERSN
jgi:hypothetical protein